MLTFFLIAAFCILILYYLSVIYGKWCDVKEYWMKRGVPFTPPNPFVGNLTFIGKQHLNQWLKAQSENFKASPYFGMWLFWKPVLVVCTPELARQVLVKDFDNFRNRYATASEKDRYGRWHIFLVNDPFWSNVRKRLTYCFSTAKLNSFNALRLQKSKEIIVRIQNDLQKQNKIDLKDIFSNLTTDIMAGAAFGVNEDATLTGDSAMRRVTRSMTNYTLMHGLYLSLIFFWPKLASKIGGRVFRENDTVFFKKVIEKVTEQRGGWRKEINEPVDILDSLLKMRLDMLMEGDSEFMDDKVISQAAAFLGAGFETTASGLSFLLMELAFHQDAQKRLYNEIRNAKEKLGDKDFDVATLSELDFLKAVVKETLRKYPPFSFLDRVSEKDYKVDEHVTIHAGTPVYVNLYSLHYNEDYFEAPYEFRPERFLPENKHKILPYTYMPFGLGPRGCIAYRMGLMTMYFVTAYLLLAYEVRPKPGSCRPNDLPINPYTPVMLPAVAMEVDFVPRETM